MSDSRPPLLAWPGWQHLSEALVLSLAVLFLFSIVYGGADWVTGLRERQHVHLPFELKIPFVPASVLGYMSMYGLFMIAPLILRSRRELRALAATLAAGIVAGGISFLLLPAELAFPEPTDLGGWDGLFAIADRINLRYNLVPSLHVTLSLICVDLFVRRAHIPGALVFWSWGLMISVSTLLLHQHHLLDIATGAILALGVNRAVFLRLTAEPMVS